MYGTQNICSFTQAKGVCSLGKVLFVTDVATGVVSLQLVSLAPYRF